MNLWFIFGMAFLLVGAVGILVPLLPTTPFILLAAGCFARSSPRMHAWLRRSRAFGPTLRNWDERRCVTRETKRLALGMIVVVGGGSVLLAVPNGWPQWVGLGLLGAGVAAVWSLKVCPGEASPRSHREVGPAE